MARMGNALRAPIFFYTLFTAVCIPATFVFADIEIPAITLIAERGGIFISDEQSDTFPEISGELLSNISDEWLIQFPTPLNYAIPAERSVIGMFKGSLNEPSYPIVLGENASFVHQALDPETFEVAVSIPTPLFGDVGTPSGLYTLFVWELPETKYVCQEEEPFECFDEPYTDSDLALFLSTDSSQPDAPLTYPPLGGRTITFAYIAGEAPEECVSECYSNVLFLPGVKGSRLVSGSDTLWPPTVWSDDVPQLALSENGESINTVQVDGVLDEFCVTLICTEIYAPFSEFLDGLVENETINEWHPFAYDWRYSPQRVVDEDVQTTAGEVGVVETIEALAENSKSGKVIIVAHSMGGLVGKALIKKLELAGKADLIEAFVMVGTPQLGTPQAIGSMLHGDEEGILGGFIVNPTEARTLARNLPSAHVLLPSQAYFDAVPDAAIRFSESSSFTEPWRAVWGPFVNAYTPFFEFMTGQGVARARPEEDILRVPEVLDPERLSDASDFHAQYDSYIFPENIRVVQIAGWGRPTVKAVEYRDEHGAPSYRTNFTVEGDGTVVYPSAVSGNQNERYYFNVFEFNDVSNSDIQHRDLLNSSPVQELFYTVLEDEVISENTFVSVTKPSTADIPDRLVVQTHSPVILGAYDTLGNFTGIVQEQDLNSEILSIREEIPGSAFVTSSESQYLFLPKSGTYTFVYKGIGNGSTTVEIQSFTNDVASTTLLFSDIPTTPNSKASFEVDTNAETETVIELDTNGDGAIDKAIEPDGGEPSLTELLSLLKERVSTLSIEDNLKQIILKRITAIEKKLENRKKQNAKLLASLGRDVSRLETRGRIASADAAELLTLITELEALSDEVALDGKVLTALRAKVESLTLPKGTKNTLLKRIGALEQKRALTKDLERLEKSITKKAEEGHVGSADAQEIIALLEKIEKAL